MKIKLILVFGIISNYQLLSVWAQNDTNTTTTGIDCKNRRTTGRLDTIFAKLYTFGESGRSFPVNSAEAIVYCKYVKNCLFMA